MYLFLTESRHTNELWVLRMRAFLADCDSGYTSCGQLLTCLRSAWIPNTELAPLDVGSETTKNPVEKGKSKTLLAAYSKAAENNDLAHFKTMLADHQKAVEIDEELKEEKAAKKSKKAPRKSGDAAAVVDDADEMDIDDDVAAEKPKSKKRKKADDSDDVDEKVRVDKSQYLTVTDKSKPAKTPKTATKLKLTTPKTPAAESSSKKRTAKPKAKATATKSGSEEETISPKAEEKPPTLAQIKEMKEKKGKDIQSLQIHWY